MLIASSKYMDVHFEDRGGDTVLITFNEMGMVADGHRYWGDVLAFNLGISIAGLVSRGPNWFPEKATLPRIRDLNRALGNKFAKRMCYGLSQGGYAVLRYKEELKATAALAFSPQASIDPDVIKDFRFNKFFKPGLHSDMLPAGIKNTRQAYVVYDPTIALDLEHVTLLREHVKFTEIPLPYIGHSSAVPFSKTEIMRELLDATAAGDMASMRHVCALARRRSVARPYLLCRALQPKRPAIAQRIFEKYRDHSRESWWLVASMLAGAGKAATVIDWLVRKSEEMPKNSEIKACTALAGIEVGDKDLAITFAEAAVELDPGNGAWAWIRDRALQMQSTGR